MPHISALTTSKFLKKGDCEPPILLTIKSCSEQNVAKEGAPEEFKWCLYFNETEKPLVLNSTNGQIIAGFIGQDNTDNWVGHKVVLFHDPSISFGGKLIGGIRARAPKGPKTPPTNAAPAPKAALPQAEDDVDY